MARKLAVSLVDTARVFEVLVAVVLIGEHLPTPFTLVPGTACVYTHTRPQSVTLLCSVTIKYLLTTLVVEVEQAVDVSVCVCVW